jgi:hypothetical protein
MDEQEKVRRQREQKAHAALTEPDQTAPMLRRARAVLRLWHYPSFGPYRAWLLWHELHAPEPVAYRVRRVTWDRPGDAARLVPSAEPRLLTADAALDIGRWRALEEEAGRLRLPPFAFPKLGLGTHGETFGVEQEFFHHQQRFQWWCRPPEGWESMAEWVARVREFFEETLPRGAGPHPE